MTNSEIVVMLILFLMLVYFGLTIYVFKNSKNELSEIRYNNKLTDSVNELLNRYNELANRNYILESNIIEMRKEIDILKQYWK